MAFTADIAAVKQKGLTYVLGETNSFSCHGAPGASDAWHRSAHLVVDSAHNTDKFHPGRFKAFAAPSTSYTAALLRRYHCSRTHQVFRLYQDR